MRLLVVEDEPRLATLLRKGSPKRLTRSTSPPTARRPGLGGRRRLDAIVLESCCPVSTGGGLSTLRKGAVHSRVLLLTGGTAMADRVAGLDAGADD